MCLSLCLGRSMRAGFLDDGTGQTFSEDRVVGVEGLGGHWDGENWGSFRLDE